MKGGVRKKSYDIFILSNYVILPMIGWYLGGIVPALLGGLLAFFIARLFPIWKSELTWKDIDLALYNLQKYGHCPSDLCFRAGDRRIFIYRDEVDDSRRGSPPCTRIRMAVRLPLSDWSDRLNEKDYDDLFKKYGGMAMYSNNRGPESYDIFTKSGQELECCKELLKILFEKSVGGLRPDIMASTVVVSEKPIWLDHSNEEKKRPNNKQARW